MEKTFLGNNPILFHQNYEGLKKYKNNPEYTYVFINQRKTFSSIE